MKSDRQANGSVTQRSSRREEGQTRHAIVRGGGGKAGVNKYLTTPGEARKISIARHDGTGERAQQRGDGVALSTSRRGGYSLSGHRHMEGWFRTDESLVPGSFWRKRGPRSAGQLLSLPGLVLGWTLPGPYLPSLHSQEAGGWPGVRGNPGTLWVYSILFTRRKPTGRDSIRLRLGCWRERSAVGDERCNGVGIKGDHIRILDCRGNFVDTRF